MQLDDASTVCICDIKIHNDRREPFLQKAENIYDSELVAQIKIFDHNEEEGKHWPSTQIITCLWNSCPLMDFCILDPPSRTHHYQ
jgi:hypothetical protein